MQIHSNSPSELPTGMVVGLKCQDSYALNSLPHVMSASYSVLGVVVVGCYLTSMWYIGSCYSSKPC